ncbi:MAG: preprotein translocase subunit SecE [Ruminococcaceae bacterium]|nr:preprotein translocase subunit SecE [Oscillospiraceae bacterium]
MTTINKRSLIALLMSFVLIISLFTVAASATEAPTTGATTETESVEETETGTKGTSGTTEDKKEETTAGAASGNTSGTNNGTTAPSQKVIDTKQSLIINAIIVGVIIVILVLVAIRFHKKLGEFFRSVKSELGKIVWSSKENTRKSFLVVAVVAVTVAIMIGLIDYAFNTGIAKLDEIINYLRA